MQFFQSVQLKTKSVKQGNDNKFESNLIFRAIKISFLVNINRTRKMNGRKESVIQNFPHEPKSSVEKHSLPCETAYLQQNA